MSQQYVRIFHEQLQSSSNYTHALSHALTEYKNKRTTWLTDSLGAPIWRRSRLFFNPQITRNHIEIVDELLAFDSDSQRLRRIIEILEAQSLREGSLKTLLTQAASVALDSPYDATKIAHLNASWLEVLVQENKLKVCGFYNGYFQRLHQHSHDIEFDDVEERGHYHKTVLFCRYQQNGLYGKKLLDVFNPIKFEELQDLIDRYYDIEMIRERHDGRLIIPVLKQDNNEWMTLEINLNTFQVFVHGKYSDKLKKKIMRAVGAIITNAIYPADYNPQEDFAAKDSGPALVSNLRNVVCFEQAPIKIDREVDALIHAEFPPRESITLKKRRFS